MKKILSLVVALIAIGQVSAKGIEPKSPVGISVLKQGAVVKLFYRGEQSGKVKVTIFNERGDVIYREILANTDQFMRPYNFSSLPQGEYTIELKDEQGRRVLQVNHKFSQEKRTAHLTRLNDHENKFMLAVPNEGPDDLQIRIMDENNAVLYQETEHIEGDFAKVYQFRHVTGPHVFEVSDKMGRVSRLVKSSY
jgi:hypothetical protein